MAWRVSTPLRLTSSLHALLDRSLGGAERRLGLLPRLLEPTLGLAGRRHGTPGRLLLGWHRLPPHFFALAPAAPGAPARGGRGRRGFLDVRLEGLDPPAQRVEGASGHALPAFQDRAQAGLDAGLGLADQAVDHLADVLAKGHGVVEAQPAPAEGPGDDPLRLLAGTRGGVLGLGPVAPGRGGAGGDADEAGQHLPGDAARALLDALEQHLGERQVGQVLPGLLLDHLDLVAAGHEPGEVLEGHVAAGRGVVELAIAVPPDRARTGCGLVGGHDDRITRRVRKGKPLTPGVIAPPLSLEVQGHLVQGGGGGGSAAGQDEGGAEGDTEDERQEEEDARQVEGAQDDPDQVEDGLLDLDPRDGRLRRHHSQRAPRPPSTVERRAASVNCLIWVRFRASR